jgi:arylsulfatase
LEREVAKLRAIRQVDWTKRGMMRGVYDGRWKFARYFSPGDHHIPADWTTLSSRNDLELYDTAADPNEIRNLASDPDHRQALLAMNAKTNALIAKEIGADLGKYIPGFAR